MDFILTNSRSISRNSTFDNALKECSLNKDNVDQTNNNLSIADLVATIPDEPDVVIITHINKFDYTPDENCCSIVSDVVERIPCHSYLLRKSPYLSKKIQNSINSRNDDYMNVKNPAKSPIIINVNVPSLESLYIVLVYLYNGNFNIVNIDIVKQVDLYTLSMVLCLDDLRHKIIKRLNSPVSLELLVKLSLAAELYNDDPLLDDCIFIISNFGYKLFVDDKFFLKLGVRGFKKLISSDNLQMDELQIYAFTVMYMKSHEYLINPYDQSASNFSESEINIIKSIRYCAMSHDTISKIRTPLLDKFLLDAVLRLSTNTSLPLRATSWKDNKDFKCVCHTGIYPTVLIRLTPKKYAAEIHNDTKIPPYHFTSYSYNSNIMLPPVYLQEDTQYNITDDDIKSPYWAFNIGSYRMISECSWIYEICRSKNGNLNIGFTFQQSDITLYRNKQSNDPFINDNVIYYDTDNFSFNSALVDLERSKIIKTHTHLTDKFKSLHDNKLCQGDRIYVDIKCLTHCLNLIITINDNPSESFSYPYKTMYTNGKVIKRPVVNVAPYIAMLDYGDAICIPEVK